MRKLGETSGAQGRNVADPDGDTRLPGLTEGASASPDIPVFQLLLCQSAPCLLFPSSPRLAVASEMLSSLTSLVCESVTQHIFSFTISSLRKISQFHLHFHLVSINVTHFLK